MAEKLKKDVSKNLYKIFLILLKYTPITLLIIDVIHTVLSYLEYEFYVFNYIGGVSLIFLIILYVLSYLFRFCNLYRLPLYYITITNIIALIDSVCGIPISDLQVTRSYFIILGVVIFLYIRDKVCLSK